MRIAIASTYVPFRRGGDLAMVYHLAAALSERAYQVETVLLPFDSQPPAIEQTLAIRSLDLTESSGNKIDLLITLRTPAQAIAHPNKIAWFSQHPGRADACYVPEAKRI